MGCGPLGTARGVPTKAIFALAVAALRLDCAASAGEAVCDPALRSKTVKTVTPTSARSVATAA